MTQEDPVRETPPFSRRLTARDLKKLEGRETTETATDDERAATMEAFELLSLAKLTVSARIFRFGRDGWRVEGRVIADLAQSCVVSLDPVAAHVDETFTRLYVDDDSAPAQSDEIEVDHEAEDPPEPLGDGADLGAAALETLSLSLDPYPRAKGATFEPVSAAPPGVEPIKPEALKPFAGLASLKKSLEGGD
ncbi:MAG: DUF177 domain-containing protein [Pseudomonadota bacterium]